MEAKNERSITESALNPARQSALDLAQQAVRDNPDSAEAIAGLGLCHLSLKQLPDAASCFERVALLDPGNARHQYHLGVALQYMGRVPEAVARFRKAISLDPGYVDPLVGLGQLMLSAGKGPEAIVLLKKAEELAPGVDTLVQLGNAYSKLERLEEAETAYRKATEVDPGSVSAKEQLGNLLQEQGRFGEALSEYKSALEIEPRKGVLYNRIFRSKRVDSTDGELVAEAEASLAGGGEEDGRQIHYGLGKAYEDLGEYEKAAKHFDEANRLSAKLQMAGKPYPKDQFRHAFDRIIKTFIPEFYKRHAVLGSDSELPIFVVGMIRSGTTLLEQVVSSHPQVAAGGELPFWLDPRANALLRETTERGPNAPALKELRQGYLTLLESIAQNKVRVTDKMPNNYMSLGLMHLLFPKARILHCHRNPIDNCFSIYQTPYADAPRFAYSKANIVFAYREYERLMRHWRKALPPQWFLDVEYEELVRDREAVTRRVIEFCGLEWNDACLHPETNRRIVRTPSRWQVRQPVYESSIERWKHYEPWLGEFKQLLAQEF